MSLYSYQFVVKHMIPLLRISFVSRLGYQLYDLYFNFSENQSINDLLDDGWTPKAASLRYILLSCCESYLPIFALASCINILSKQFQRLFLDFMMHNDAESPSIIGSISGWLFIVTCVQAGITNLSDDDRYWKLLRNLGLIVIVNLHYLFKPISDLLQSLSTSRSKAVHKHARVLIVGFLCILLPSIFLAYLWSNGSINSWTLTVTVFSFEMITRMLISLVIYTMCMINSFCDITWSGFEDQIYYLKALCGMISYLCGISLFCNGTWVWVFENYGYIRGFTLFAHLYLNIWNQAWKGWSTFSKRRMASIKINCLRDATREELIELDDLCSICFQKFDQAKITDCNHYFHANCLTRWLYFQDTCPICSSTAVIPNGFKTANPRLTAI